jgi:methylated-DNA-[protein]-cysteine S-methyltransferase
VASKNIIFIQYFQTVIGELIVGSFENQICVLDYRYRKMRLQIDQRLQTGLNAIYFEKETSFLREAQLQITAYLNGTRKDFTLPIKMVGTPFQCIVWKALKTVPYGSTISYLELAKLIGNKKAVRAVAAANGANAIALMIPCHRVIGSNNKLVGYAGGLPVKKRLLQLELTDSQDQNEIPFPES